MLVQRSIPTPPADRGSASLYPAEAERQGIRADRKMLYIGLEPASEHVAHALRVEPDVDVVARRKMFLADDVPARIATSYFRADMFADLDSGEWIVQVLPTSYSTEDRPLHAPETICAATRHIFPIGQVVGVDEL